MIEQLKWLKILFHMYGKFLQLLRGTFSNLIPHLSIFTHVGRLTIESIESHSR